jgi:hypothetical protein
MSAAQRTLESILQGAAAPAQSFARNSRYFGLPTLTMTAADGRAVAYVARRFVPSPEQFAPLAQHSVVQGDRLDNIAAQHFGDPQQFWRLCDANNALRPDELVETLGRRIVITLPAGVAPGTRGL